MHPISPERWIRLRLDLQHISKEGDSCQTLQIVREEAADEPLVRDRLRAYLLGDAGLHRQFHGVAGQVVGRAESLLREENLGILKSRFGESLEIRPTDFYAALLRSSFSQARIEVQVQAGFPCRAVVPVEVRPATR